MARLLWVITRGLLAASVYGERVSKGLCLVRVHSSPLHLISSDGATAIGFQTRLTSCTRFGGVNQLGIEWDTLFGVSLLRVGRLWQLSVSKWDYDNEFSSNDSQFIPNVKMRPIFVCVDLQSRLFTRSAADNKRIPCMTEYTKEAWNTTYCTSQ